MPNNEKEVVYKRKTKSIVFRVIFSRMFVIALAIIAEALFLVFWFFSISSHWSISSIIIFNLLTIIAILNTNNQKNEYKILWITILILLPGAGIILYFSYRLIGRFSFVYRKKQIIKEKIKSYAINNENVYLDNLPIQEKNTFFNYLYHKQQFLPMINNDVKYFDDGKDFFDSLKQDLLNAKNNIFLEFFIISDGKLWTDILKILKDKANEGIDVKLMYDGLNITNDFSIKDVYSLRKHGAKVKMFGPIIPLISSKQNNRDHRKIVVIDNNIAYTGGMNLADEYVNYYQKYGVWKDAGVRIEGDCAKTFAILFLQVWMISVKNIEEDFHKYLPYHILNEETSPEISTNDFSYICSYTDYPNDDENVSEDLFTMMINYAYDYIYIMTPYLILNESLIDALIRAKKRGVDVRILIPHIPDKKYVYYVSRCYYKKLLSNGIRCYEFTDGFVHSKVFCHDDKRAIVGTANFDYRSLYLHFEDGLYIYNDKSIKNIKKDFVKSFSTCLEIKNYKNIPLYQRIIGSILKIFAPLL